MRHITEYENRKAAAAAYAMHRKTWSRQAALILTHAQYATSPIRRLAAEITLIVFDINTERRKHLH
jgi:hypothetical protein